MHAAARAEAPEFLVLGVRSAATESSWLRTLVALAVPAAKLAQKACTWNLVGLPLRLK